MKSRIRKIKQTDGFILIVAVGMVFLLMIVAVNLVSVINDTNQWMIGSRNYSWANDIGDSVIEEARFILKDGQIGYNTVGDDGGTKITCAWGKYANNEGGGQNQICQVFNFLVGYENGPKDVKVTFEIKGRAMEEEKVRTTKCGSGLFANFNADCYTVPFPGMGDAGTNCNAYRPSFNVPNPPPNNQPNSPNVLPELANNSANLDQADYSCNWNKLIFGSSIVDRVSIPFYYQDENGELVNPFQGENAQAHNFILRLRTPCKPCGRPDAGGNIPAGSRNCGQQVVDETVCDNRDRYVLNTDENRGGNQIVVQWKLSGKCDSDEDGEEDDNCGMVAVPDEGEDSAIYEERINLRANRGDYFLLENTTKGNFINAFPASGGSFLDDINPRFPAKLSVFSEPTLSLFLSSGLIDEDGYNIPYLEYQVLTDEPIALPKTIIDVEVMVDHNGFSKTVYKEVPKELIDFAVQN